MKQIGVLGFQGSVEEHMSMLRSIGVKTVRVNAEKTLSEVDALIIPGGESTTFLKILHFSRIYEPLKAKIKQGLPIMATCAGIILLASHIDHLTQESMGILPISVNRNGYGRQIASFCEEIAVDGLTEPFKAIFIRAPILSKVDPSVKIIAHDSSGNAVLVQKEKILGATFHPELTDDHRIHEIFIHLLDKI